ncbi:Putative uncharacterized protein [Taphrina deformans PYCC 5710]|uniref:DUF1753-domain-containing protein n=1 Tax=Taphrina deformans (strain PYCC 5710 / ATCC 11124 / CBS 356.35 / IMI 108563 / JCM 9778 / NBRC 8474) TaxID=1097556 RepID=R5A7Z6_TAPDE|nr:Putative uncharacterized protein [Taphrina deformans PYCC 5710]|eukprot:CCX35414.1 Putative uncharacterized protein [Taphrina deformans PYCC 5710]
MLSIVPKPKSFLHFMSLQTGAELICIFTVFNKASGLYGLLALITGAPISAWQMSMYLYSIMAAGLFAHSLRHIQGGPSSTLEVVSFAWLYVLDTLINFGYTALFASTWFLVLSQQGGSGTADAMNDTAGFTSPTHTVSSVTVAPTRLPDGSAGTVLDSVKAGQVPALGEAVLHPEQIPSIVALVGILLVKIYFCLVVLSFARVLVRKTNSGSMSPYQGWQEKAYSWMTKGGYWSTPEDLRLSKTRSLRRSAENTR